MRVLVLVFVLAACSSPLEPEVVRIVEPRRLDPAVVIRQGDAHPCAPYNYLCDVVRPPIEVCLCDPPRPRRELVDSLIAPRGLVDVRPPHVPGEPVW